MQHCCTDNGRVLTPRLAGRELVRVSVVEQIISRAKTTFILLDGCLPAEVRTTWCLTFIESLPRIQSGSLGCLLSGEVI